MSDKEFFAVRSRLQLETLSGEHLLIEDVLRNNQIEASSDTSSPSLSSNNFSSPQTVDKLAIPQNILANKSVAFFGANSMKKLSRRAPSEASVKNINGSGYFFNRRTVQ